MMSEIMLVPLPLAASRRLISFLTFQISIFFSASFAWGALMVAVECVDFETRKRLWWWWWWS